MVQVSCLYAFEIDLPAQHSCAAHQHACTEIVWCDGCAGELFQGPASETFHGNSLFVYQPGKDHWINTSSPGRQICIGVTGAHAEDVHVGVHERYPEIDALFAEIKIAMDKSDQIRLDCYAGLIVQELRPHNKTPETATPAEQAKSYIDEHLAADLSIERIAQSLFISPDYLRQLFKKTYGDSIMHYVIQQRLDLASHMLSDSGHSIKDIAEQCGFQSPYYFSRLFKKYRKVSPSVYRKQS